MSTRGERIRAMQAALLEEQRNRRQAVTEADDGQGAPAAEPVATTPLAQVEAGAKQPHELTGEQRREAAREYWHRRFAPIDQAHSRSPFWAGAATPDAK